MPSVRSWTTRRSPDCDTVRIVHGRGTGAVRAAVQDELGRHPLVEGFEADSAGGATDASLARAT